MRVRLLAVLVALALAAALPGAMAEGLAVSGEAHGHRVSLVVPEAWDDLQWGGDTSGGESREIGEWGVFEDGELSLVAILSTDVWQAAVDRRINNFGVKSREECVSAQGNSVGNILLGLCSTGEFDTVYEEIGEIWYLRCETRWGSDPGNGTGVRTDILIYSTIQDGVRYDVAFCGPVSDAGDAKNADVISGILSSLTFERIE